MSIEHITERGTALEKELEDALYAGVLMVVRCQKLEAERDGTKAELATLQAKVASVHKAKGRYHSQLAMCALYDACGLLNVKPVTGVAS